MSAQISAELFDHLALLAALELDPSEKEYLRGQLNKQLKAIEELEAVPLDPQTPPAAHGVPYTRLNSQPARADDWQAYPDPETILNEAPESEQGYIIVPEIPHSEL